MGGLLIIVASSTIAVLLWRIIVLPMRRLTHVVHQIRDGHFSLRVPVEGNDEVGLFAAAFNDMTTHICDKIAEIQHEKEYSAQLQQNIITAQDALLHELSTPLYSLAHHVVAMPIIGTIDSTRAHHMMQTLLEGIVKHKATIAIIDITGVPNINATIANALVQTAHAVRLLGTRIVITGIRADVAHEMVKLDVDLDDIVTYSFFQDGIAYALKQHT